MRYGDGEAFQQKYTFPASHVDRRPGLPIQLEEPAMVHARCIVLAVLSYSACGRAFMLRPRVASAHVIINRPHGFVGVNQRLMCRALGSRTAAVVVAARAAGGAERDDCAQVGVHPTEDALSPPGEVGVARPRDVRPAGVAAAVAGVALAGGLLHPELANAADSFGEL